MTSNYLKFKEAREYLGLSDCGLRRLIRNKLIKHYKPGGKIIYFKKNELDDFVESGAVTTRLEVESKAKELLARG